MRKFIVNVNGTSYEIEVEETTGKQVSAKADTSSEPKSVPLKDSEPIGKPEGGNASGYIVECPMPGTILEIKIRIGDNIKRGDVLFILEAMKMENEIIADQDGIIADILVNQGNTVESGEDLCIIK